MNLLKRVPGYVLNVLDALEQNNHKSYLVGGAVRDLLLCKQPKDYDITTSALPEQVKSIFSHVVLTGEKHGTVTVVTEQGNVEVTTMRKDGVYKDNRRPETVGFTDNIIQDLSRRDFTINAMGYNKDGLIDPFGGSNALCKGQVIAVGNPTERFREDALRMMRAIRFACQLDFLIDTETFVAITRNKSLIRNISAERIRDEVCKILVSDMPSRGIELMRATGLLNIIMPEINNMVGFDQHNPHHHKDVYKHTLLVLDGVSNNLIVRLAALLHDVGKPIAFVVDENGIGHFYKHHMVGMDIAKDILQRLKFDNKTIDAVCILVREHMSKYDNLNVKRLINRVGVENLDNLFELQIADIRASKPPHDIEGVLKVKEDVTKIINEKQPLTVKDLKISGYDLMALGMEPGREMGKLLNELLELVLENPKMNNEDCLIRYVREKMLY